MSYKNATQILPAEILELVQEYIDGEYLYIPRKDEKRREWGSKTTIRQELEERNNMIFQDYVAGMHHDHLVKKYFLSLKSIQRIICQEKKKHHDISQH